MGKFKKVIALVIGAAAALSLVCGCSVESILDAGTAIYDNLVLEAATIEEVPEYSGAPYTEINGNEPVFDEGDKALDTFEEYSELDFLGRCGAAYGKLGKETMPNEKRGDISSVHPTGWSSSRYEFVDGQNLYNRCHLIGFMLSGENANEKNLITGTRYMNTEGMLPFENQVADYIISTGNHVMYRVTPIFDGANLLASGVHMEAESVEDSGRGVKFNVYCYNVQPGITINYATGGNYADGSGTDEECKYVLNTNSKRFHKPGCESEDTMNPKNRREYTGTRASLINAGYIPCGYCKP